VSLVALADLAAHLLRVLAVLQPTFRRLVVIKLQMALPLVVLGRAVAAVAATV
jgi:hypothetical protein